jgi:hypothetical protein
MLLLHSLYSQRSADTTPITCHLPHKHATWKHGVSWDLDHCFEEDLIPCMKFEVPFLDGRFSKNYESRAS